MGSTRIERGLGSTWAFLATALILLAIFGATFVTNPHRPAAADDPAYYTWRTETLVGDSPEAMLGIHGPLDMYSSGYRVATPVIGGMIRRISDVGSLIPTIVLAVGLRVLIPMLLAGFAYRHRRDPLIWHAVAFGSASLLVTPPFAGYLDNVMTLMFLTASLYFIEPSRTRWSARIAFFVLLLLSGMTHPTTLAIFCVVLGAMAAARLVYRRFDLRSVVRDDGPMLVTAFLAAVLTYVIWKVGIWGPSASLSEAALPPPASADFFKTRLGGWVSAMRPLLNGPLFVIAVIALLRQGRAAAEDQLARVSIVWLAPLAGVLGAVAGLTYPYYRFFNTTLAWVLLVGLGAYFLTRFFIDVSQRGGINTVALIGVLAIALILAGNFKAGLDQTHWNDPSDAWLKPDQREALDAVKSAIVEEDSDRPIVFVADDETTEEVRIYGFAKLVGNVSRYAVPGERQDRTAYYLGGVESFLRGEPSGEGYHRELSQASLDDAVEVGAGPKDSPLVIVADVFNRTGENVSHFESQNWSTATDAIFVSDGTLETPGASVAFEELPFPDGSGGDAPRAIFGALLLLLPGWLLTRALLPGASSGETLGMVPVLGISLIALVTIIQLAVTGSALTSVQAWVALIVSVVVAAMAFIVLGPGERAAGHESGPTAGT
jgi:hypothetical protein